jgi:hypothetical protein
VQPSAVRADRHDGRGLDQVRQAAAVSLLILLGRGGVPPRSSSWTVDVASSGDDVRAEGAAVAARRARRLIPP